MSIDNAVAYVHDLYYVQDLDLKTAMDHATQRFGVSREILERRFLGYVADPDRTMRALAKARSYLTGETFWEYDDADELADVLREVYEAITGEHL